METLITICYIQHLKTNDHYKIPGDSQIFLLRYMKILHRLICYDRYIS